MLVVTKSEDVYFETKPVSGCKREELLRKKDISFIDETNYTTCSQLTNLKNL